MKLTYDPKVNLAYIYHRNKRGRVRTIAVSDELNVDIAADGTVYGIELLNANEQLAADGLRGLVFENKVSGQTAKIPLHLTSSRSRKRAGQLSCEKRKDPCERRLK
jgi:uncharacterized protein YuzE